MLTYKQIWSAGNCGCDQARHVLTVLRDRIQCLQKMREDDDIDVNSLCDDMKKKARCSETGIVIDQKDVDTMLEKLNKQAEITPRAIKGEHWQWQSVMTAAGGGV